MTDPDIELVKRTAALARLEITDDEAARLGPQFRRILEAFRTLTTVDVEGIDATTRGGADQAALRPDEPRRSLPREPLLENAPDARGGFYSVPKTVGGDA